MAHKQMINILELAFSPVNNYDFIVIRDDKQFQTLVRDSALYIITQRREMMFDNFSFSDGLNGQINAKFELKHRGKKEALKFQLPLYQPNILKDITRDFRFHFEYGYPKPSPLPTSFPMSDIRNIVFSYHDGEFASWLSPENLIQNYLNGHVRAEVEGNVNDFLIYQVHYVGKATEQDIWKRLTGHSKLQDILSLEFPIQYGSLPTHEIAILFIKAKEYFSLHTIGPKDSITSDMIDSLLSNNLPSLKTVAVDAEKALIAAMQPKYNKEYYKNYPVSKDGLYPYSLDHYTFQIASQIILSYTDGNITGNSNVSLADTIYVKKGEIVKVIKFTG